MAVAAGPIAPSAPARVLAGDPRYPRRLLDLEDAPAEVWTCGDDALANAAHRVAIVGTRRATQYGERVAHDLAAAFARAGAVVVSGMARGIDAAAHRGALAAAGPTVAVLGTGADVPYPPSHRALYAEIRRSGLVLSERPPGAAAHRGAFLQRNRLIAALADATIVVEAGVRSGALNTAEHAESINRTVATVPGRIDDPQSAGTNGLLRLNAQPITCIDDALALLGLSRAVPAVVRFDSPAQQRVWEVLARPAATLDDLAAACGLPARECFEAVTMLELQGAVECEITGGVRRRG